MSEDLVAPLVNHLWQSTVAVAIAWLLALALRKNHARARYWVWFAASVKFLLPFSLLMTAGEWLRLFFATPIVVKPALAKAMEQIAQPFPQIQFADATEAPVAVHHGSFVPAVLLAIWACGALIVVFRFGRGWLRVYAAKRTAQPLALAAGVPVFCARSLIEPGIYGVFRPVLLLPEGILERLIPEQLRAVVVHEMCHVRRRDNLTFAMHMIVEALFWFHPAVWWIGARLIEERECACDEAVLQSGSEAETYAEGILNVCKFYVESPLECVAGVTGSDLKQRIVRIMAERGALRLTWSKKSLLVAAVLMAVIVPVVLGLGQNKTDGADWEKAAGGKQSFDVASIREDKSENDQVSNVPLGPGDVFEPIHGFFSASNYPLIVYIRFAYKMTDNQSTAFQSQLPSWVMADRFDIQARVAGNPTRDQVRLMMQGLLRDRFKFAVHYETKQVPVFALELVKAGRPGPMLRPHAGGECSKAYALDDTSEHMESAAVAGMFPTVCGGGVGMVPSAPSRRKMGARDVTLEFFATSISGIGSLGRPVLDKTGLTGTFDFALEWTPESDEQKPSGADPAPDASRLPFVEALKEQLGLKLKPERGPVDFLVFDHIERPSPN